MLVLLVLVLASTQTQSEPPRPAFDFASVKLAAGPPAPGGYSHQITPTGITMLHVSLGYCIRIAWGLKRSYELVGPGWLDPPTEVLVDIAAGTSSPVSEDRIRVMLQGLLVERFRLSARIESRDLPTYSLVAIRKDPALRPADGKSGPRVTGGAKPYSQAYHSFSMAQFAMQLGPPMTSRPVIDKTGIEGSFDFELDFGPYIIDPDTGKQIVNARGAVDSEGAAIQALRDQLGLALKADRAPFPVLVIDHVEKIPTAN